MSSITFIEDRGAIYTKREVVQFMLDQVNYTSVVNLNNVTVLEPSAGEGSFVVEIVERLYLSALNFGFDFEKALGNIYIVEINKKSVCRLKKRLESNELFGKCLLDSINYFETDFLIADINVKFDLVVGNPPYIRWDKLSAVKKELYAKKYHTFKGRSDIYVPFYEKSLGLLKEGGVLNFICSNRWFKSSYGKYLRKYISANYRLDRIINLENAAAFDSEVIAYPAITVVYKERINDSYSYRYSQITDVRDLKISLETEERQISYNSDVVWSANSFRREKESKFYSDIVSQGFVVKIGIATGKDSVFIIPCHSDFIEKDLLVPMLKANSLRNNKFEKSDLVVINVFNFDGSLIDLCDYPKLKQYLLEHSSVLKDRHIAKKRPKSWYRTIDKLRIEDVKKTKILLPDISGNKVVFIDEGEYYPHHNIYYITHARKEYLHVLAGILMSDFTRNQLSEIGNKMNGGYPRWQSQNLRRLVLPVISKMSFDWVNKMTLAYKMKNIEKINELMEKALIEKEFVDYGQMTLFENEGQYSR